MNDMEQSIFSIASSNHSARLEFFSPVTNAKRELESFDVRFSDNNLSAATRVYTYLSPYLPDYFRDLAAHWDGWLDSKDWTPLEGEIKLSATNDGRGHIKIALTLRSWESGAWVVTGAIVTEAGLLERIAHECSKFIGGKWFS